MNRPLRLHLRELLTLNTLAIAGPTLKVLGDGPSFFVNARADRWDVLGLVLLLIGFVPFCIFVLEWGLSTRRCFNALKCTHALALGILAGFAALPLWSRGLGCSGSASLTLSVLSLFAIFLFSFRKNKILAGFLQVLSPIVFIAPLLFFVQPGVRSILTAHRFTNHSESAQKASNYPPVVAFVFDEFSLNAILDANLSIDKVRFPNLAAFASQAHWFRNTSSVNQFTPIAVPSMLSGHFPKDTSQLPTVQDYPVNLFTELSDTYDLHVLEPFTRLCPETFCPRAGEELTPLQQHLRIWADVSAIFLNYAVPTDLDWGIPELDGKWGDFWNNLSDWSAPDFSRDRRVQDFRKFIQSWKPSTRPQLIFAHVILPHMPYQFAPSGRSYRSLSLTGYQQNLWVTNETLIERGYQQYLMQIGAVDTLLGEAINALKVAGIYDNALVVLVADHGVSFEPETYRRGNYQHARFYEDVLNVPLLIKRPGQTQGFVSDRNVETIDVLPSILDALGLPWQSRFDGESVWELESRRGTQKQVLIGRNPEARRQDVAAQGPTNGGFVLTFEAPQKFPRTTLDWKLSLPGFNATNAAYHFSIGPFASYLGSPISALPVKEFGSGSFRLIAQVQKQKPPLTISFAQDSTQSPMNVEGMVSGAGFSAGQVVGLAVNDTLVGFTRLVPSRNPTELNFAIFPPESVFKPGKNAAALYLVKEHAGRIASLDRIRWNRE